MKAASARPLINAARVMLLACMVAGPLAAAPSPSYQRPAGVADEDEPPIVAGYRALFTCSAHFFAGRPLAEILQVELVDTRKHGFPDPVIDEARQLVIAEDGNGNRRIAAFRGSMGCTVLPPHLDAGDVPHLPYVAYDPAPRGSETPFPAGDAVELGERGTHPDFAELQPVLERAFDGSTYGEDTVTVATIVLAGDRIVAERYRPGFGIHTGYRTWSTAKSISAAVLGVAARQGLLDLDSPAAVPEWQYAGDPRAAITYKHLLWMSSGLESGGNNTYAVYFGGQDVLSAVTTTALEVEPGSRWKYANNDTLLYLRALRHVLGDDLRYLRFPYDELLHRIGMYHTRMESDHRGHFVGSSQVYTTARDLARFGLLLANDGVWNGERLLPEGWVEFSGKPAPARKPVDGEWGYGAQFWLLDRMPGVPEGTFTTAGNKGQYVTVVPARDIVIVRTGVDPNGKSWAQDLFVAEIVSLLE